MKNFRDLKIWHRAHSLTLEIYKITSTFPKDQKYSLTSQLQRACISIEANIAEGCGRSSNKDFNRFLYISMGSASEVDCLLEISKDLQMIDENKHKLLHQKITEILKMLSSLINKIKKEHKI